MTFNGQENDLNKIAVGYFWGPTSSCPFVLGKQHTELSNHKMNRSSARTLCKRDPLHLTCSVRLNFNYSPPMELAREGNANDGGRGKPALHFIQYLMAKRGSLDEDKCKS